MHRLRTEVISLVMIVVTLATYRGTRAENWPQFRGPTGLGTTNEKNLPTTWNGANRENVAWKTPLVGEGHASPIVWGDRVFVCTARFQVEHVLPSSLSTAAGAAPSDPDEPPPPEDDFDNVVVRIEWIEGRPSWRINDAPVATLDQLRKRLDQIARIKSDATVILHPDQDTPVGSVIDVYDISRLVGFDKVQFAASQDI